MTGNDVRTVSKYFSPTDLGIAGKVSSSLGRKNKGVHPMRMRLSTFSGKRRAISKAEGQAMLQPTSVVCSIERWKSKVRADSWKPR